jgi:hypothetical protein
MDEPHLGTAFLVNQLDDFATYSPVESPSSLNSSFSHEITAFMPPPLPPKPSPRHRNLSYSKAGYPAKQWPPRGFKAPTLLTGDPTDEHADSTSPETDWLSPASRSSNTDDYSDPPTFSGRWSTRSATDGGARQWQGSPTSPSRGRISPKTMKLQLQLAERFGQADSVARANSLARVKEGYILTESNEDEIQRKWQRYQQEELAKRQQAKQIQSQNVLQDGQWPRPEFRRYERPVDRSWHHQGNELQVSP